MATIYDVVAGADRLNASLAGIHQANFARLGETFAQSHQASFARLNVTAVPLAQSAVFGQISTSLAQMNQANFARLGETFAHIYQTQLTGLATLNANLIKTWQPLLDSVLDLERLDSLGASSVSNDSDGFLQRLSDREIATMLTVVAFLAVYISFALLIERNPQVARLAATDGPTPFEAAMAVGALVFWLSMKHFRGSRGE
jgi:hypothetical protein